jgi:TPR repeat protein
MPRPHRCLPIVMFVFVMAACSSVIAQSPPASPADLKRAMDAIAAGDYASAIVIFKPMAEAGDPLAQFSMGQLSESGTGLPKNVREAARWYKLAAEAGQTDAMTNLGFLYEQGRGVPQDYKEALRLYTAAADAGNPIAQTNLGNSYFEGRIVKQDYAEAAKWYRKAGAQHDAQAQFNLARMYDTGRGVERDPKASFGLYREAAGLGLPAAQLNVGVAYAEGRGVAKDPVEAHRWFNLAAGAAEDDNTRDNAARNRDVIGSSMTPEQVERAQKLAREWKPAIPAPAAGNTGAVVPDAAKPSTAPGAPK